MQEDATVCKHGLFVATGGSLQMGLAVSIGSDKDLSHEGRSRSRVLEVEKRQRAEFPGGLLSLEA